MSYFPRSLGIPYISSITFRLEIGQKFAEPYILGKKVPGICHIIYHMFGTKYLNHYRPNLSDKLYKYNPDHGLSNETKIA